MGRTISINTLLKSLIGLIALGLVAVFASSAYEAWRDQRTADRIYAIAEAINPLFIALQNLRVERGTVNTALATTEPANAATRSDVAALRAASGPALERAVARLETIELNDKARLVGDLVRTQKAVTERRPPCCKPRARARRRCRAIGWPTSAAW